MDLAYPVDLALARPQRPGFLEQVAGLVDWTDLSDLMDACAVRAQRPFPLYALKIALLKRWYGLADNALEPAILDRLSFRAFVGIPPDAEFADRELLDELRAGHWRSQPEMDILVAQVEEQLGTGGYVVRPGELRDASIEPRTEGGDPVTAGGDTAPPLQVAEIGRMVEALTAKAQAEGRPLVEARQAPSPDAGPGGLRQVGGDAHAPAGGAGAEAGGAASDGENVRSERVRAVLHWPWGQRTELVDQLRVGRDFAWSPHARDLSAYQHVSRRHCELVVYGDSVWVRDLGSRNGTFVNEDQVPSGQAYLVDADVQLRFGPALGAFLEVME